jgi:hypothetical protein
LGPDDREAFVEHAKNGLKFRKDERRIFSAIQAPHEILHVSRESLMNPIFKTGCMEGVRLLSSMPIHSRGFAKALLMGF